MDVPDLVAEAACAQKVAAIAEVVHLPDEGGGAHARHLFELRRVHLRQDDRPILAQQSRRAAERLWLGAFNVDLDEADRTAERVGIERDNRDRPVSRAPLERPRLDPQGTRRRS